jgi:hypothetical protein
MAYLKKNLPEKFGKAGMLLSGIGVVLIILSFIVNSERAFFGYLWMYMFLVSIGVGSLALVALEYLVGATWSTPFRRISEFLSSLIPLLVILVIPLFFGLHDLYHWTHQEVVDSDPVLKAKEAYLNVPFFTIRTVVILGIWITFFFLFIRNSVKQDTINDPELTRKNVVYSAIFAILFILTMSITAIDWMMSLEPHWFSTIYGIYYFAGTIVASFAATTLVAVFLNRNGYLNSRIKDQHYYSLGTLMFGFNIFWAYIAFSQYLLIWYEETFWFLDRMQGSWAYFSIGLVIIHFVIPFLVLLPRSSKVSPKLLVVMSIWLLGAHLYDLYWLIMPTYAKDGVIFSWNELGFLFFATGLIMVVFKKRSEKINLEPVGDPKLESGLNFHLN